MGGGGARDTRSRTHGEAHEIKAIDDAMTQKAREFLARYGGFGGAMRRSAALQRLPEAKLTEGVSIDDYSTWRAVRLAERDEIG